MFLFSSLFFIVFFAILQGCYRWQCRAVASLRQTVDVVCEALLVNDLAKIQSVIAERDELSELLGKYFYLGQLQVEELRILQQVFMTVSEGLQFRHHLRLLFVGRSALVMFCSLGGNFLLGQLLVVEQHPFWVIGASVTTIIVGYLLLDRTLPSSWFWRGRRFTVTASNWLNALFDPAYPFTQQLQEMHHRQLTLGIDLSQERRQFLQSWYQQQRQYEQQAIRRHQDLFPLVELLVFGILLALSLSPVIGQFIKPLIY